jgi:hypothetical protein
MTTMSNQPRTPLDEVLYEFSLAKPEPDAALIDEFVRRYPEYSEALTDLAVSIVLDAARGPDDDAEDQPEPSVSQAVSLAMSRFQNRLYEVNRGIPAPRVPLSVKAPSVENPFLALDRSAFRALTVRMHCNAVFMGMLRDREINPDTITNGFTNRLADEMNVPAELLAAHFAQRTVAQRQYYKADNKPRIGAKVRFEEAVRSCGLSEDQQAYLLGL